MKNDFKMALRPFHRRMTAEAALRSIFSGGLVALPLMLICALLERAGGKVLVTFRLLLPVWGLASLLFYGLRDRAAYKKTAARIDQLGLKESISTMVEFAEEDSVLCKLQRREALKQLEALEPSVLPIRISRSRAALCLLLLALVLLVPAIPQKALSWLPVGEKQVSEEERMLHEKVDRLRETVQASGLEAGQKGQLLAALDELESQIAAGKMDISMLSEITRTMEEMEKEAEELKPLATYAQALLEQETLKPLGEAIMAEDITAVRQALSAMGEHLNSLEGLDQVNAIMAVVYDIGATFRRPIQDEGQAKLNHAMAVLSGDLENAADLVYNNRDNSAAISRALTSAGDRIEAFLGGDRTYAEPEKQKRDPDEEKENKPRAQAVHNEALRPKLPSETEYVYDPPENVRASSYAPGEQKKDGTVEKILAPKDETLDGTVPYGKVFGRYYAKYLEEQSRDALPEDVQEELETYFNGM